MNRSRLLPFAGRSCKRNTPAAAHVFFIIYSLDLFLDCFDPNLLKMRLSFLFNSFVVILFINCLFHGVSQAQRAYDLSDANLVYRLDRECQIFVDSTGHMSFNDILKPELQKRFRTSGGNLTFGYLKSTIWLKLHLHDSSPGTRWMLEIPAPFLEYVDFYQSDSVQQWRHSSSGYYRKFSEREVPHTGHALPLQFMADSSTVVYARIGGVSPKTFPVYVMARSKFTERNRVEDLAYGIFFGILIVMFLYNLAIYMILRQSSYLYYFLTILFTFLIFGAISGYGSKFLWPETPGLNYFTGKLSIELLLIFLSIFMMEFLEVRKYSSAMYYLLVALIGLSVLAFILVAAHIFPFAGNTLVSFAIVLLIAVGIVVRIKGNRTADYFIAAWTIYFCGGLLIALRNIGFLDYNFWTTHFVEIGAVLQTAIIGFALGDQYRRYKKEKEEAQRMTLKVQEDAMAWLENKVRERTEELSQAHEDLRQTLEKNMEQTLQIENKNAELDAFFHSISHDLKGPISSLLGLTMLARLEIKDNAALLFFEKQQAQLERLSHFINGLVKLTKLDRADLQTELIDFNKMIDDCIQSFHSFDKFGKVTFEKEVRCAAAFYSEWTLLNGIVQNLIENSIKYAREDGPYVRIGVHDEPGGIVLRVEDNGRGIPREHHARIFEMFYRVNNSESGSGLGLYILKRSVDRLKGTIEIESDVNIGTTFIVHLPSLKPDQSAD